MTPDRKRRAAELLRGLIAPAPVQRDITALAAELEAEADAPARENGLRRALQWIQAGTPTDSPANKIARDALTAAFAVPEQKAPAREDGLLKRLRRHIYLGDDDSRESRSELLELIDAALAAPEQAVQSTDEVREATTDFEDDLLKLVAELRGPYSTAFPRSLAMRAAATLDMALGIMQDDMRLIKDLRESETALMLAAQGSAATTGDERKMSGVNAHHRHRTDTDVRPTGSAGQSCPLTPTGAHEGLIRDADGAGKQLRLLAKNNLLAMAPLAILVLNSAANVIDLCRAALQAGSPVAKEPTSKWKLGDEWLPYHPSASHIDPDYRDGWNHAYEMAVALYAAPPQPVAIPREPTDQTILIAQELVRVFCTKICDEVDVISGWDGDPTDVSKRFKAGISIACEEIKCRINNIDFEATWNDAIDRQLDDAALDESKDHTDNASDNGAAAP